MIRLSEKELKSGSSLFKITKDQWPFFMKMLGIALLGVIILLLGSVLRPSSSKEVSFMPSETRGTELLEEEGQLNDDPTELTLEKSLEEILSKMEGVGSTSVSIVYAEGKTKEYAINVSTTAREIEEKDQSGGVRSTLEKTEAGQMVTIDGHAQPVLVKESMPKIQGVLVVASGAKDPLIREKLFRTVQTLLQVPAHRVSISTKKGDE